MAEAKITLKTIIDDEGLNALNTELAKGQTEAKRLQRAIKDLEKNTSAADKETEAYAKQLSDLQKQLNQNRQANASLTRQINGSVRSMEQGKQATKDLTEQLKGMVKQTTGIDLAGLKGINLNLVGIATACAVVGKTLVDNGREVSRLSNQFIAFANNMDHARDLYGKFNEVARNMNSSYDEEQIYKMGKGLMAVGIASDEAAALITKCADASAKLGQGAEFTEQLTDAFKRLYTGGQLTEKQYKALAEAGIDLTDVQEQMAKGGMAGYEALSNSLNQYKGGMAGTKTTAEEMEADIKANMVEIARQTALLVDDFFGFSDSLKEFYQWVIDTSQAVIDSIKGMISSLKNAKATASDHADVLAEIGTIEEAIGDKSGEAAEKAAVEWQKTYNERMAMLQAERKEIEANEKLYNESAIKPVKAISGKSGGGGGGGSSAIKDTTDKDNSKGYQMMVQSQKQIISQEQTLYSLKQKSKEIMQQMGLIGLSDAERISKEGLNRLDNLEEQKDHEIDMHEKRIADYEAQISYLTSHPFDGSVQKIENLKEQIGLENELHLARIDNLDKQIELNSKLTADAQNEQASKLTTVQQYWENYAKTVSTSMGQVVSSVVNGEKTLGQALKEMAQQMISNALTLLAQWLMLVAIFTAFRDAEPARHASAVLFGAYEKNSEGKWQKKATGGYITGAGTSTSDSIPTMLSNGEYVLNSRAVDQLGVGYLDSLNAGMNPVQDNNPIGGNSVTLSVNAIDSSSFADFLARGGLSSVKQALFEDDRQFGSTVGVW